jgi:hypothetical protein
MTENSPPTAEASWKRFVGPVSALLGLIVLLVGFGIGMTVAFSSDDAPSGDSSAFGSGAAAAVEADFSQTALNINVSLTADGIEPDIIFIPAGRPIRLVLTNRDEYEHHFRVEGLVPTNLRWMELPEIDEYDVASMTPDDLVAYGIEEAGTITDEAELAHYMHHLVPQFVPSRPASPSGIRPLGTEVHGWVIRGTKDVMEFVAQYPGEYEAEDVRYPEHTARVIVFDPTSAG